MSRYRLLPSPVQEAVLRAHCAHARFVWNVAVEQHSHWRPGRTSAPGYLEQCQQLTQVPQGAKSYRVTLDQAGRWHIAFANIPDPIPAPGNGKIVGIDRGVAVSAALSTGELTYAVGLTTRERGRMRRLERRLARARSGSNRRGRVRLAIGRLRARETDRRKDWAEKTSTNIAERFDVIRIENLKIKNMTRSAQGTVRNPGRNVRAKAGLN